MIAKTPECDRGPFGLRSKQGRRYLRGGSDTHRSSAAIHAASRGLRVCRRRGGRDTAVRPTAPPSAMLTGSTRHRRDRAAWRQEHCVAVQEEARVALFAPRRVCHVYVHAPPISTSLGNCRNAKSGAPALRPAETLLVDKPCSIIGDIRASCRSRPRGSRDAPPVPRPRVEPLTTGIGTESTRCDNRGPIRRRPGRSINTSRPKASITPTRSHQRHN